MRKVSVPRHIICYVYCHRFCRIFHGLDFVSFDFTFEFQSSIKFHALQVSLFWWWIKFDLMLGFVYTNDFTGGLGYLFDDQVIGWRLKIEVFGLSYHIQKLNCSKFSKEYKNQDVSQFSLCKLLNSPNFGKVIYIFLSILSFGENFSLNQIISPQKDWLINLYIGGLIRL